MKGMQSAPSQIKKQGEKNKKINEMCFYFGIYKKSSSITLATGHWEKGMLLCVFVYGGEIKLQWVLLMAYAGRQC